MHVPAKAKTATENVDRKQVGIAGKKLYRFFTGLKN